MGKCERVDFSSPQRKCDTTEFLNPQINLRGPPSVSQQSSQLSLNVVISPLLRNPFQYIFISRGKFSNIKSLDN